MIRAVVLAVAVIILPLKLVSANEVWALPDGHQVVFMDAVSALHYMQDSHFMRNMTALDVSLRMKRDFSALDDSSARAEYSHYLQGQVKDWSWLDKRFLRKQLTNISKQISAVSIQVMPDTLYLIRTTGDQEFNAFYTIKKAIIFPGIVRTGSTWMPYWWTLRSHIHKTIIHEIFHIFSTEHPKFRDRLYQTMGFYRIYDLNLNPRLRARLITNPDDKQGFYRYTVFDSLSNREEDYVLLIMSKYPTWEGYVDFPSVISVLLVYLDSKLHQIEFRDGEWRSSLNGEGSPIVIRKSSLRGFLKHIGLGYDQILSPEEIIAEYWVLIVETTRKPKLLKKMSPSTVQNINRLKECFEQRKSTVR